MRTSVYSTTPHFCLFDRGVQTPHWEGRKEGRERAANSFPKEQVARQTSVVDSIPSEGEAAAHVHASPEWTWTGGRGTSVADSIPLEGEAAAHVHASPEWNCMAE